MRLTREERQDLENLRDVFFDASREILFPAEGESLYYSGELQEQFYSFWKLALMLCLRVTGRDFDLPVPECDRSFNLMEHSEFEDTCVQVFESVLGSCGWEIDSVCQWELYDPFDEEDEEEALKKLLESFCELLSPEIYQIEGHLEAIRQFLLEFNVGEDDYWEVAYRSNKDLGELIRYAKDHDLEDTPEFMEVSELLEATFPEIYYCGFVAGNYLVGKEFIQYQIYYRAGQIELGLYELDFYPSRQISCILLSDSVDRLRETWGLSKEVKKNVTVTS